MSPVQPLGPPIMESQIRIGCLSHAFSRKMGAAFWGSPRKGNRNKIGSLSHGFSRAQKWAEVLCHPCILGSPQQRGVKSELAAASMPSRGHKSGRCILGVPDKVQQK